MDDWDQEGTQGIIEYEKMEFPDSDLDISDEEKDYTPTNNEG